MSKFDLHLQGLVRVFNELRQQHETQLSNTFYVNGICLQNGSGPGFVSAPTELVAEDLTSAAGAATQDELQRQATLRQESAILRASNSDHISTHYGAHTEGTKVEVLDDEKRALHHQFLRLDKKATGTVDVKELLSIVMEFGDGTPPQDLALLVDFTNSLIDIDDDLTFHGFVVLNTDQRLTSGPAPSSVQQDAVIVREALRQERENALNEVDKQLLKSQAESVSNASFLSELVPGIVILLNSLVIGLASDAKDDTIHWFFIETVFCAFYVFEASFKFKRFGFSQYLCGEGWKWNIFDMSIVGLSIVDITVTFVILIWKSDLPGSVTMLLKMMRLSRLLRLVRTLRFRVFNELKLMVFGLAAGFRTLLWAILLFLMLMYVFAVTCTNLFGDEPELQSVLTAMFTVFQCVTDGCPSPGDIALPRRLADKHGYHVLVVFVFAHMCVVLGVFNLIMAVFIDQVTSSQQQRKLTQIAESRMTFEVNLKEHLVRLMVPIAADTRKNRGSMIANLPSSTVQEIQSIRGTQLSREACVRAQYQCLEDSDVVIGHAAFLSYLGDKAFRQCLVDADIEANPGAGIFDFLDADMSGWLSVREIYEGLMSLRGPVNKPEVVGLRLKIRYIVKVLHSRGMKVVHG
eukprot:TRINITY_DN104221_c0_g1_i1.p1 TRINITY_DN104221_c0_g1~~TRINITY_DN104221_c0_g1_i1.p1  ORF type:complete len:681 (+),score=116.13 TRINITY_DN104221_c0_g1_i1:146-2044(+)